MIDSLLTFVLLTILGCILTYLVLKCLIYVMTEDEQ
jgi:hypothetical protein